MQLFMPVLLGSILKVDELHIEIFFDDNVINVQVIEHKPTFVYSLDLINHLGA